MKYLGPIVLIILTGVLFALIFKGSKVLWPFSNQVQNTTYELSDTPAQVSKKSGPEPFSEEDLFKLIQEWRTANGLSTYKSDPKVCAYALLRLGTETESLEYNTDTKLFNAETMSHDGFRETSKSFLEETGFTHLGENLSTGMSSEKSVLGGWLNSPSHRENLDNDYTVSCLKCHLDTCVHIFAK